MSFLHHRELIAPAAVASPSTPEAAPVAVQVLPLIDQALRLWHWSGLIALLLFADLRGSDPLLGWLPFWLLLWPLGARALLHLRFGTRA